MTRLPRRLVLSKMPPLRDGPWPPLLVRPPLRLVGGGVFEGARCEA